MASNVANPAESDVRSLLVDILAHVERLLGQQAALLRSEIKQELGQAAGVALAGSAGGGLLALGGLLSTVAVVHWLHRSTALPLWACYAAVAGALGAGGGAFLGMARRKLAGLELGTFPQTAAALKENLAWLKEQVTTSAPS